MTDPDRPHGDAPDGDAGSPAPGSSALARLRGLAQGGSAPAAPAGPAFPQEASAGDGPVTRADQPPASPTLVADAAPEPQEPGRTGEPVSLAKTAAPAAAASTEAAVTEPAVTEPVPAERPSTPEPVAPEATAAPRGVAPVVETAAPAGVPGGVGEPVTGPDVEAGPDAEAAADEAPARRRGRLLPVLTGVLLLLVLAAGTLLVLQTRAYDDRRQRQDDAVAAAATARALLEDFQTWQYGKFDDWSRRLARESAPGLAGDFDKQKATLTQLASGNKVTSTGVVLRATSQVTGPRAAVALVYTKTTVTGTNVPAGSAQYQRWKVSLVEQGGQWKASALDPVNTEVQQ